MTPRQVLADGQYINYFNLKDFSRYESNPNALSALKRNFDKDCVVCYHHYNRFTAVLIKTNRYRMLKIILSGSKVEDEYYIEDSVKEDKPTMRYLRYAVKVCDSEKFRKFKEHLVVEQI